jgi:hypothetical protein
MHIEMWKKTLTILVLIMAISLVPEASVLAVPVIQNYPGCTYVIPPEVTEIDQKVNNIDVKPGDVLCLPAGERPNLKLFNLHGTEENPIIVRNAGGKVLITGELYLSGGIGITDSSYLRITGSGVTSRCGASYSVEQQACGIEVGFTHKGVKLDLKNGDLHDIEIDHLYVHDTSTTTLTRGISIHPPFETLVTGLYVHNNFVTRTSAEGIYLGSEPQGLAFERLGKIEDIEVSYNLVMRTGFDGIKVKIAINNVRVHHNRVIDVGLSQTPAHQGGIKIAMSVGDFYNNYVSTGHEGIRLGRKLPETETRFFNNVVVGALVCLETPTDVSHVFNNTVVNCGDVGISARGADANVYNNIVAGVKGIPILGYVSNISNNFVGPVSMVGFFNPEKQDYRICSHSPAVDASKVMQLFPGYDFMGVNRPQGRNPDFGAYEYVIGQPACVESNTTTLDLTVNR